MHLHESEMTLSDENPAHLTSRRRRTALEDSCGARAAMKFRFCGDLDAPDWLLAEISTISKLASVPTSGEPPTSPDTWVGRSRAQRWAPRPQ